jgi:hypothetical protein
MSQWTDLLLLPEPGIEYFIQGVALHHCLPNQNAARGGADWHALLYVEINQIPTRQNLLRPLPAGVPGRHRIRHQAFLVDRSLPGNCIGRGVPHGLRRLQMRRPILSSIPIPTSPTRPAENCSKQEAGKYLQMSGQGREDPTIRHYPSGQGSATADNPSGLSGQGSKPPSFKPQLRFAFKRPCK